MEDICQASGVDSLVGLRNPLQLSALISPLILLAPQKLIKQSYNRTKVLTASHRLGNLKPPLLQQVERKLWEGLFYLVEGTKELPDILDGFARELPWDQINNGPLVSSDRYWFKLGKNPPFRRFNIFPYPYTL